jgi:hypothetical protein
MHGYTATREAEMAAFAKRLAAGVIGFFRRLLRKWTSLLALSRSVAKTDHAMEAWYHPPLHE